MAALYNSQRVLGVRLVADGTLMHNGLPVIGIKDAGGSPFVGNLRTLGVSVLGADQAMYNDQPVRGAVAILDARTLYNGSQVLPYFAVV